MPERSAALVAVIPARIGSTRFPEKPLARIAGVPMITRVVNACANRGRSTPSLSPQTKSALPTLRATRGPTPNDRLLLGQWNAAAMRRCANGKQKSDETTWVVNVQGDEPFVHPEQLQKLAQLIRKAGTSIATLARPSSQTTPSGRMRTGSR